MAKVRRNSAVYGLSGKFGRDLVFRHLRNGQTVAQTPPDFSDRVLSKDQKAHHERFKAAAAYARNCTSDQIGSSSSMEGRCSHLFSAASQR